MKNITEQKRGFCIRLQRGTRVHTRWVRKDGADCLARAVEAREALLKELGPVVPVCRSNTGKRGIWDGCVWINAHERPYVGIKWTDAKTRKKKNKRVYYGRARSRSAALRKAVALRKQLIRR
jgi:hypothetical protein